MAGGFGDIMKQAKQLQEEMQRAQEELATMEITGEAGGGMVRVTMNGRHDLRAVDIDPALMSDDKSMIEDLVAANRILAAEGILPGYGHVSARHPEDPSRYFLSRAIAPELVTADDILELDLESVVIEPRGSSSYLERFIHGEIYKARPDVQAVVHNHSPTVISFGIGSTPLRPVFHQAAFFLDGIPIWDYRDFGTAEGALVDTPARAAIELSSVVILPGSELKSLTRSSNSRPSASISAAVPSPSTGASPVGSGF